MHYCFNGREENSVAERARPQSCAHPRRVYTRVASSALVYRVLSHRLVSCRIRYRIASCLLVSRAVISIFIDRHRHVLAIDIKGIVFPLRFYTISLPLPLKTENRPCSSFRRNTPSSLPPPHLPLPLLSTRPRNCRDPVACFAVCRFSTGDGDAERASERASEGRAGACRFRGNSRQHLSGRPERCHPLPRHSIRDIYTNSSISFIPSVTTALSRAFVSNEQPPATPLYLLLRARPFGSAIPPHASLSPSLPPPTAVLRRRHHPLAHPHVHSRHLNNKYSLATG